MNKIKAYTLVSLFLAFSAQAANLGTEIKAGIIYEFYQSCVDENGQLSKLAEIGKMDKKQFCGCLLSQVETEFSKIHLEQRLNSGEMTIKQMEQETGEVGERAAGYCVDRLYKD